ncbi:MAG: Hsp20/alpha crystallin family protein [Alphaproteobacteria bacterium]|nr:Hsp20/alpha crystallin family protein [Alphaproteobacteria bacterium]
MRKNILPVLAAALLNSTPADAQMAIYHDPFNTYFDSMFINPQKFETKHLMEPRMDMADLKDKIVIKAELPGMDENNVKLSVENNVLTLSGERKQETEEENNGYYFKETSSGSFSRSIRLPKNIDDAKIDAVFKKGLLTISIPKKEVKEEDNIKTIPIKSEE